MRQRSDRGASAVEFGLLVAALAVGIVGAASIAGRGVGNLLSAAAAVIGG